MPTARSTNTGIGTTVFKGLKTPRSILQYNLMRGVTDFSNLEQWDFYEKGYPFLVVVQVPQFLQDLAKKDADVKLLLNNYVHILENDFRGIDNLDNITGEANGEITNGIRSIQLINKVTKPSNSNFTMRYYERSGSILTKLQEFYLTGIKDPDTQVKHYHGLIDDYIFNGISTPSGKDPGPHQECWAFMYFMTDNTMTKVERAFLISAVQPTAAPYSELYTGDKGEIQFTELNLSFNGFFMNNDMIYIKAQKMLMAMRNPENKTGSRIIVDSNNFAYDAINKIDLGEGVSNSNLYDENINYYSNNTIWTPEGQLDKNHINNKSSLTSNGSWNHEEPKDGAYAQSIDTMNSINKGEHLTDILKSSSTGN